MGFNSPSMIGSSPSTRTVGRQHQGVVMMLLITLLLIVGIGSRLGYLQLVEGPRNRILADQNRIRLIPKQPERGRILDRRGRPLAGSKLSYSVFIWPIAQKKAEWPAKLERLSKILQIPQAEITNRLEQAGYTSPFLLRVARGITPAQVTALAEFGSELEGIEVDSEAVRFYPHKEVGAHVLGYTGELTDEALQRRRHEGYRMGDVVGQMGVELAFESMLRGEWGGQQVEVDGKGQIVRTLGQKQARAGRDVTLTLDLDLQKAAERVLGERKGAIVAMDPRNGAVLAMISHPSFDPNIFSARISPEVWQKLQGEDHPFVNRALQGFPPASTFKIVTTVAAIESGTFSPDTVLPTYPYVVAGGIQFWDWNRAGFGPLSFTGAMAWSSDTFFYQTAMAMGHKPLIQWTKRFGFGRKTGIEIMAEEAAGLVPDEAWKRQELEEGWYQGDTINMSIGQGFLQTSPLQVAVMFSVPANGGFLVKPHLLKDDEDARNYRQPINISSATIKILQQGLRDVVTSGTGSAMDVPTLPPNAGKTGTAEDPPRLSHAWYGGYAPVDAPEIVVVAFAENSGGGGGAVAAPMVRSVLEAYFNKKPVTQVAPIESVISD